MSHPRSRAAQPSWIRVDTPTTYGRPPVGDDELGRDPFGDAHLLGPAEAGGDLGLRLRDLDDVLEVGSRVGPMELGEARHGGFRLLQLVASVVDQTRERDRRRCGYPPAVTLRLEATDSKGAKVTQVVTNAYAVR